MKPNPPKIRTVQMTYLHLSVSENPTKFLREFKQILKDNFQVITEDSNAPFLSICFTNECLDEIHSYLN